MVNIRLKPLLKKQKDSLGFLKILSPYSSEFNLYYVRNDQTSISGCGWMIKGILSVFYDGYGNGGILKKEKALFGANPSFLFHPNWVSLAFRVYDVEPIDDS